MGDSGEPVALASSNDHIDDDHVDPAMSGAGIEPDDEEFRRKKEQMLVNRRIARRNKILQNRANRMEKITGRSELDDDENDEFWKNQEFAPTEDLEKSSADFNNFSSPLNKNIPPEFLHHLLNGAIGEHVDWNSEEARLFTSIQANRTLPNFGAQPTTSRTPPTNRARPAAQQPPTLLAQLHAHKLHLIILAVVTYVAFIAGLASTTLLLFVPLLVFEVAEVFILRTYEQMPAYPLLNVALMFAGIKPEQTTAVLKILSTLNKIVRDVAFYMFFFVLTHLVWEVIVSGNDLRETLRIPS